MRRPGYFLAILISLLTVALPCQGGNDTSPNSQAAQLPGDPPTCVYRIAHPFGVPASFRDLPEIAELEAYVSARLREQTRLDQRFEFPAESPAQNLALARRYGIEDPGTYFAIGYEARLYLYTSERGETRVLKLARAGRQDTRDALVEEARLSDLARAHGARGVAPLVFDPQINGVHRPHYPFTLRENLPSYRVHDVASAKRAIRLLRELGANFVALHRAGIIFRDLNPKNIFFEYSERPILTDFGISAQRGPGLLGYPKGLPLGNASGTLSYMSPGQMRADTPEESHDLFALGTVAWEVVTGQTVTHPEEAWHHRELFMDFEGARKTYYRPAFSPASLVRDFPDRLAPLSAFTMMLPRSASEFLEFLEIAESAVELDQPEVFFAHPRVKRHFDQLAVDDPQRVISSQELWFRLERSTQSQVQQSMGYPVFFPLLPLPGG